MTSAIQSIPLKTIDGKDARLADYAGSVLLIVNTASKCGLTPQYEGLEALYRANRDKGLVILGFPANNFLAQEPGTEEEIAEFCSLTYDVSFPMFAKISVAGEDRHPLYAALTAAQSEAASPNGNAMRERLASKDIPIWDEPEILWNFEKFLVSRDGQIAARFGPDTPPDDPALLAAIQELLD
ncbi:glutathione peroxidase [Parasphingopyxis lamellibrachiae]|uniref:Glutathione peroxidase n=1 Tax=Parasphingopyxis lamellibrachiae TaxID=680125 RepID=A0A3D9FGV4_9SPHN|nr:glutathione peroxidase [Parasphingopyxis lamellibrachiae]RED16787.1 glutathione peroxidase [Parasphingopyxis lamellibrachiae]